MNTDWRDLSASQVLLNEYRNLGCQVQEEMRQHIPKYACCPHAGNIHLRLHRQKLKKTFCDGIRRHPQLQMQLVHAAEVLAMVPCPMRRQSFFPDHD